MFLDSSVTPLPADCIVRTPAHNEIISQNTYVVIGRKGSGKSTLLNAIQHYDPAYYRSNYKELVSMDIETLDINFIYNNLIGHVRKEFDFINMSKILDTFWEILFVLQGITTIGFELESFEIEKDDRRHEIFKTITDKLKKLLGISHGKLRTKLSRAAICHCAVELLTNHIQNKILDCANEHTLFTSAYSSVDAFDILSGIFGPTLFEEYCLGVQQCRKKIFLALDGFDTHSEDFRKTTNLLALTNNEEYRFRTLFETRLFRELLLTISNIKNKAATTYLRQAFFSAVHFCVIMPQDRYDEIALDDRDIAKRNFCSLSWDAYDLMEMLVKRLERYYRIEESQTRQDLKNRFDYVIQTKMPNIPTAIEVAIDGYNRKISLFNYLLRLSFWRPRDIIKNFAIIMKLSKENDDTVADIVQNIIKKFLVHGAKNIIENEFINEYKNVYLNIREILLKFKFCDFMQEFDAFYERLSRISIHSVTSEDFSDTDNKLRLLYKLGIIGLYYNQEYASKLGYGYHICYSFNEGLDPIDDLISRAKIVFNPIFAKYLILNFNTKELICDYSWEYIIENHALKDYIRRI